MPFAFSTPYLYSTLTFGGDKKYIDCLLQYWTNDTSYLENAVCADIRICVRKGSYLAQKVSDMLDDSFTVTTSLTVENFYGRYGSGDCTVLAADQFQVSKNVTSRYLVDTNFDNYTTTVNLIPIKSEPIGMITRKDDITWSDFVNYVVYGLIYSERKGYTRAETLANPDAIYYAEWDGFGADYKDMFLVSNQAVGPLGEIYERNLEQFVPRQTINTINNGLMGGVIYSMSLGNLTGSIGLEPDQNSTLQKIQDRNSLNCGVNFAAVFAEKTLSNDGSSYIFSGFDVDFCRALSAAIFDGDPDRVNYIDLSTSERFDALQNGTVDVLSRVTTITPNRDILYTFSQPTFFDTFLLGGLSQ
jgi:ABC-type amino acid transport substrate-binding protein